ncbi:broad-complex core protein isoforms 1/2/3/4/5-like isoform X1 [Cloeon dipterum]|uniref:broad-complex core protein isoforms 1/2/3/4/5-like isoform X1 n=1 Tax=Cloeon dipterum TaxID=197152 RepID=UPI003220726D
MNTMEDDSEQFSLRWNNFHTNMSSGFQELLEDKSLVDVTLACEGQYIQAHRAVLTVCSPYFKALFKVNPNNHPIIILKDVSFTDLKSILQFMYRGEVNVKQDDLNTFLKTAEVLKVKGLTGDDNKESTRNVSQLFQESQSPQMKRRKIVEAAKPSPPPPLPQPKEDSQPKIQFITIKQQNEEENEEYIDDDDDDNEQDFSAQDESLDLESQICLDSGGPMGIGMRSALDIEGSSSHSSMQGARAADNTAFINGEKSFVCGICNKAFVTNTRLSDHVKYVHVQNEPMICEYCNKTYKHYNSLRKHIWHAHRERKHSSAAAGEPAEMGKFAAGDDL